ncbi:hypothetical protein ACFVOR_37420 [Streptomyces sp. NPDC057837]|uniref:hypothetical protein n=1 Tax=Streptomyces sp. NPDC057837 TaxID=3346260 RepID=UPI003676E0EE
MKALPCPTPWRIPHRTQQLADTQRIRDELTHGAIHQPYLCRCGTWHLTPNLAEELPTYLQPTPDDIQRIQRLNNRAFRDLVDSDVKKTAPGIDRITLRHPDLLTRWRHALKALLRDVHNQLEDDGTPGWREKATVYEEAIRIRLNECRSLRQHALQKAA